MRIHALIFSCIVKIGDGHPWPPLPARAQPDAVGAHQLRNATGADFGIQFTNGSGGSSTGLLAPRVDGAAFA
jgi:hypothetical protein